ncbi:MAG: penicillin acylase family protein, partial [Anaerolineae bacterium]|nr:penicillin acylase family protein [Anaerolineae bacterium]
AAYDWLGYVDFAENPRLFNPPAGFIVSANNPVTQPDDFPYPLASVFDFGFRAARIEALLLATEQHTPASFAAIQNDNHHPAADFMLPALAALDYQDPALAELVAWLSTWDGQNDAASPQAALFNAFWAALMPLVFDELPFVAAGDALEVYQLSQLVQSRSLLWENAALNTSDPALLMTLALERARDAVVGTLGPDREGWRWADLHLAAFRHDPLGWMTWPDDAVTQRFNREIGVSGGATSPNATGYDAALGLEVSWLPSMRFIVDFGDLDGTLGVLSLGQSGDPASPHYADQMPLWASGQYIPLPSSPAAVQAAAQQTWLLQPGE